MPPSCVFLVFFCLFWIGIFPLYFLCRCDFFFFKASSSTPRFKNKIIFFVFFSFHFVVFFFIACCMFCHCISKVGFHCIFQFLKKNLSIFFGLMFIVYILNKIFQKK